MASRQPPCAQVPALTQCCPWLRAQALVLSWEEMSFHPFCPSSGTGSAHWPCCLQQPPLPPTAPNEEEINEPFELKYPFPASPPQKTAPGATLGPRVLHPALVLGVSTGRTLCYLLFWAHMTCQLEPVDSGVRLGNRPSLGTPPMQFPLHQRLWVPFPHPTPPRSIMSCVPVCPPWVICHPSSAHPILSWLLRSSS